ncbi:MULTISPECIES: SIP domain-containing protein [unclassified Microbacterium]|uniref:SIP domain-containing protein n=1 Tax=unclassified Microbacterium TaxID=2609290 RepID=UPI000EA8EE61|nr:MULTISPECIES: SIP domain-containing protein [unclassified Microbacterium]MBT2485475.1 SIP domain-containing protein [Microbacterium sp. ISL-108]RKN68270.1 phage tail protein [Microbacterium sp. CGR2]
MNTALETRGTRAERRAARRRAHHLVTADEHSLAELEVFLTTLPLCASGRIFIEVPDATDIGVIDAPGRMTVTWLARGQRSGAPGSGRSCSPGEALARATSAWADEMMCDAEIETQVTLLGGYLGTADIVDHLTNALGVEHALIRVPERFGLRPTEQR